MDMGGHAASLKKAALRLLLVMATVLGSLTFTTGQANAVSCYGWTCDGRDPQGLCGGDARTVLSTTTPLGVRVELRYSPTCRTAWVRVTHAWPGDFADVDSNGGTSYTATVASGHDVYTLMVDDVNPLKARACGGASFSDMRCTGWF